MKIEKKNYFVKLLSGSLVILNLISCNPNQPQPQPTPAPAPAPTPQPSTVLIKWSLIIDGQTYSWQGDYPPPTSGTGGSTYVLQSSNAGQLVFSKNPNIAVAISKLGMSATGTYTISQANYNGDNSVFSIQDQSNNLWWNNSFGGSINVNITTFPSNSFIANNNSVSGITNNVKVIGTFSGTIGKNTIGSPTITTSTISGSFESIRIQ